MADNRVVFCFVGFVGVGALHDPLRRQRQMGIRDGGKVGHLLGVLNGISSRKKVAKDPIQGD